VARHVRDARIEGRDARRRLPLQSEPHWRAIVQGVHVGYYKGRRSTAWVVGWASLRAAIARSRAGRHAGKSVLQHSGYARQAGFGGRPALPVVGATYDFVGDKPEPIREAHRALAQCAGRGRLGGDRPYRHPGGGSARQGRARHLHPVGHARRWLVPSGWRWKNARVCDTPILQWQARAWAGLRPQS
jgi:hypothetical protein